MKKSIFAFVLGCCAIGSWAQQTESLDSCIIEGRVSDVADGVNVDYQVLRIKTAISENGGKLDKDFPVPVRDKKTRKITYEQLDEDLEYSKNDFYQG